jgi:hypothetical protein
MRKVSVQVLLPLFVLAAFVLAARGYAQNITGSISGHIVDPSGAAVPNATVLESQAAKKTTVTTSTTPQGDFSLAGLLPGNYDITVEVPGFKKLEDRNIELDAQDHLALGNLKLEIGATAESVQVSGEAPQLQTDSVGVFLLLAIRNPLASRSLIAFTAWSSFAHVAVMGTQALRNMISRGELVGVAVLVVIGVTLIALAPAKQRAAPASRHSSVYQPG